MTNNFGEIIHKLLDITCEKNFRLANYLGYDVTYISKWINGSKLPSQKNITEIIDGICQFFMDNINESSLRQLCYDFELINNSKESVKNELSRYLYDSYESQKLNKNKDYIINNNNLSCDYTEYYFFRSTIMSIISYLCDLDKVDYSIKLGEMLYYSKKE